MCGLIAILLHPTKRPETDWQRIRSLFVQNLIANEERGRDATGMALIQRDGRFQLFKQPIPASDFVKTARSQEILNTLGPETVCLLGHTRLPTKGSRWNNDNNHPLLTAHTLGIHNGKIHNDDELFAKFCFPRQGEVDSEVIFQLLDTIEPTLHTNQYLQAIGEKVELLNGSLASIYVDLRCPTRLIVLKKGNPLSKHYESSLKALFFSSRYLFLRQTFGRTVVAERMENQMAYVFEAEKLPQGGRPVDALFL